MNSRPDVFLWQVSYSTFGEMPFLHELPESDRRRSEEISNERRKIEFVCGRYLLRKVFAERFQTELPPILEKDNYGKPRAISARPFNISHSKSFIAVAVSHQPEIGLDIELESETRDVIALANHYGTKYEADLIKNFASEEEKRNAFYKVWNLKESFAKATGEGLASRMQDLKFDFSQNKIQQTPKNETCVSFHTKYQCLHVSVTVLAENSEGPHVWLFESGQYHKLENVHFEKFVISSLH